MDEPTSTPPPIICLNDRVLLHYAVLDDSIAYSKRNLVFVGDREIGWVPCLAISQNKASPNVTVYLCERDWSPIAVVSCESVDVAKKRMERRYPGVSARWVEAPFTEEDAIRFVENEVADLRCSFCGKSPDETMSGIFKENGSARICGDCVRKFHGELEGHSDSEE